MGGCTKIALFFLRLFTAGMIKPCDIGVTKGVHWTTPIEHDHDFGHSAHEPVWAGRFYHVPQLRHQWGEAQYGLHAGAKELFLDLIFVGIAYEVGISLKANMYSCTVDDPSAATYSGPSSSGSSSSSNNASGYSGRMLDEEDEALLGTGRGLALASAVGDPVCNGLWLGLLHSLAPFMAAYMLWGIETRYNSRMARNSQVHQALDLIGYVLLILIAFNVQYVTDSRRDHHMSQRGIGLSGGIFWILCASGIWVIRTLEISLFSDREGVRRQSAAELWSLLQIYGMYIAAFILSYNDFDDDELMSDIAAALIWAGNIIYLLKRALRPLAFMFAPSDAIPIERCMTPANQVFEYHRNNEFMFLMLGESVLQMVISSRAKDPDTFGGSVFSKHNALIVCSFVMAWSMLVSFRHMVEQQIEDSEEVMGHLEEVELEEAELEEALGIREISASAGGHGHGHGRKSHKHSHGGGPVTAGQDDEDEHHSAGHAHHAHGHEKAKTSQKLLLSALVKKSRAIQKFWALQAQFESVNTSQPYVVLLDRVRVVVTDSLWQLKTICVMLVGVGIKLALYKPAADSDTLPGGAPAEESRILLGVSLSILFSIQMWHSILVNWHNYSTVKWMTAQPGHLLSVLARFCLMGLHIGTCFIKLQPFVFVPIQTGYCVVQCVLIHLMMKSFPLEEYAKHPLHNLPHILNAMRVQRKIASVEFKKHQTDHPFKEYTSSTYAATRTANNDASVASQDSAASEAEGGPAMGQVKV